VTNDLWEETYDLWKQTDNLCKETYCLWKRSAEALWKETHDLRKETYDLWKEAHDLCKETYDLWNERLAEALCKETCKSTERSLIQYAEPCIPTSSQKSPGYYRKRLVFYVGKSLYSTTRALYSNIIKKVPCILWKASFILCGKEPFILWKSPVFQRHQRSALYSMESALYSWEAPCILSMESALYSKRDRALYLDVCWADAASIIISTSSSSEKSPAFYTKCPVFYVGKSLYSMERALYSNIIKKEPCIL